MQRTAQEKKEFWQGHIAGWKKSSVGIREYCERILSSREITEVGYILATTWLHFAFAGVMVTRVNRQVSSEVS